MTLIDIAIAVVLVVSWNGYLLYRMNKEEKREEN